MPRSSHALPSEQCAQLPAPVPKRTAPARTPRTCWGPGRCRRTRRQQRGTGAPRVPTRAARLETVRAGAVVRRLNTNQRSDARAGGNLWRGDPGAVAASASTASKVAAARERVGREQIGLHDHTDSAACGRMRGRARCQSARVARRCLRCGGWEGVAAAPNTICCATRPPAIVPGPVTGLMADSEQDDMIEDAEDRGDEQQHVKTRKMASGRVLIHSKEGTSFKHLKSTNAVLLGGEVVDRAMLLDFLMEGVMPALQGGNNDAQTAADVLRSDPIGLSVDGM
eukprot:2198873-Prymnesium_polylepis.1